jgi:hypothetical protein
MEALTDQQHGLVAGSRTTADEVRLALMGTNFEGLGAANFCDDCLLAILDNPKAFGPHDEHTLEQNTESVWCSCGVTYDTREVKTREDLYRSGFDWVQINRLRMRHLSDAMR